VDEHEEMIAALEARDGARLSSAMVDHLAQSWERIRNEI
jgi:DNA-binding GntR family transcriptional regulator